MFADASGYGSTIVSGYGNITGTGGTYAAAVAGQNNQANHGGAVVLGGNKVVTTGSFQILPSSH